MAKQEFWRITQRRAKKKGAYNKNDIIHESLIESAVLVFDDVNKILFHITREKVGFKFSDFDCDDKLNQKEDKKQKIKRQKSVITHSPMTL